VRWHCALRRRKWQCTAVENDETRKQHKLGPAEK
jgi:hypothetical protein